MASDDQGTGTAAPQECSACRGTGTVVSNLGGSPNTIACPWCDGTRTVLPGHDAQAHWAADAAPAAS